MDTRSLDYGSAREGPSPKLVPAEAAELKVALLGLCSGYVGVAVSLTLEP